MRQRLRDSCAQPGVSGTLLLGVPMSTVTIWVLVKRSLMDYLGESKALEGAWRTGAEIG